MGRSSIDPEQHQRRLPNKFASFRIGLFLPDVGVPVLRASYDPVRVGSPINGGNKFVVLRIEC